MSIPTAVFLDTSVLDGQQYNFQSTALSTFAPACAKRSVKLLLPDPTEREIRRHIRERSLQALNALEDARRKAPFLAKWRGLQQDLRHPQIEEFEVHRIASEEWAAFLKQFSVIRLGYEALNIAKVMKWYDDAEAPFREGKKRKEFPDAFAIAMLEAYAQKERIYVAVVSADPDFKLACQRFGSLLYFQSLPRLTEVLLSDDARLEKLRLAIEAHIEVVETAIFDELHGVSFYHRDERFDVRNVDCEELQGVDTSIVGIGDDECTITFYSVLVARVKLRWEDDSQYGPEMFEHTVKEKVDLSGTAKLSFSEGTEEPSVILIALDEQEIRISETPFGMW